MLLLNSAKYCSLFLITEISFSSLPLAYITFVQHSQVCRKAVVLALYLLIFI